MSTFKFEIESVSRMCIPCSLFDSVATFCSSFLEGNDAVEDEAVVICRRLRVLVHAEVANALELEAIEFLRISLHVPKARIVVHYVRVLVEVGKPVFSLFLCGVCHVLDRQQLSVLVDSG